MEYREELFGRELTRKQFLHFIGVAMLGLFGLGNVIAMLTGKETNALPGGKHEAGKGFGSRKFGN
jgi:hypothetical protein